MRPEALFQYFADIESLPGIGKRSRQAVEALAGPAVKDVLFHMPASLVDRRPGADSQTAREGAVVTLEVTVLQHTPPANRRQPHRVTVQDAGGFLSLVFFHGSRAWIEGQLPEGSTRLVSGRLERYQGRPQMSHPDYILPLEAANTMPALEPVYPLTRGLSNKGLMKAIRAALDSVPDLDEWQDPALLKREGWPAFRAALVSLHQPESPDDVLADSPARRRLAFDELLATQLALALARERSRRRRGRALMGDGNRRGAIFRALPYSLTGDQQKALSEIVADMEGPHAMLRLLQGDVGSGKTVVAALSMALAVEAGAQAALIAPTEILARQHLESLTPLLGAADMRMALLTGRVKGRAREAILRDLAAGRIDVLVGTHALIQDAVTFRDLGLAVIDEQHRFGVQQRLKLARKATRGVDTLVMTATPIPRTLTLTAYGDLDVSRIREKPPGRQPIDTRVLPQERLGDVMDALSRKIADGARAYWVCPLVAESETSDLAAAEERFADLQARFGDRVALVHGRMKGEEKDAAMARFQSGEAQILVATTVIEVGVDVPEATIMVIEQAERFGLAQLHQLRGRVGRGSGKSTCLLIRADDISDVAKSRLNVMRETEDGFLIAEEDLRLRGAGEVLGTRQSGLPDFQLVDLAAHTDLIEMARDDARRIVATDPTLDSPRGQALRLALYLFERDEGIRLMQSG